MNSKDTNNKKHNGSGECCHAKYSTQHNHNHSSLNNAEHNHEEEGNAHCHNHAAPPNAIFTKYPVVKKAFDIYKKIRPLVIMIFANIVLLLILNAAMPGNQFLQTFFGETEPYGIIFGTLSMFLIFPKFLVDSYRGIKAKSIGITFTVTLSVIIAYILSLTLYILNMTDGTTYTLYFDTGIAILVFISLGLAIEDKISSQSNYDIKQVLKLKNTKAQKLDGTVVSVFKLKKGERVVANKNSDILVDGRIVEGSTYVSESFLTGELNPIRKDLGSIVQAGSSNIGNRIVIEVENNLNDSNISRIVKQSKQLANAKPPLQKIADKIARWLILVEFVALLIAFLYKYLALDLPLVEAIVFSVSIFVIVCPCALGILTPGILLASSSILSKRNILIKNKNTMENIRDIKVIAFDKTGTVVSSNLLVSNWTGTDKVLSIAKGLEAHSEHPLAKALLSFNSNVSSVSLENVEEEIGIGLKGTYQGNQYMIGGIKLLEKYNISHLIKLGEVVIVENNKVVATFEAKSKENPKLLSLIRKLNKKGYSTFLLSGDKEDNVKEIAQKFEFSDYISQMTPGDKEEKVRTLQEEKGKVVFVGDGINDIVALAKADVSVSVASDYNAFNLPSDVVIFNDQVSNIHPMMDILQKTRSYVVWGLIWSIIYNLTVVVLIVFLSISPTISAAIMVGSDVFIMLIILSFKMLKLEKKKYYEDKDTLTKRNE